MKLLGVLIVRGGISALLLAGAMACKETDGFQAVELQEPSNINGVAKFGNATLTPEASEDIKKRLIELKDIEDELAIKSENIGKIRADIEQLQQALAENSQTDLTNQVSNEDLQNLNAKLQESVDNAKKQEQDLLNKLKDLVKELSKYETTDESKKFREEVASSLNIYEADKAKIAEDIAQRKNAIQKIQSAIADLEAKNDNSKNVEIENLKNELTEKEEELLGLTARFETSEELAQLSSCAVDPSKCPEEIIEIVTDVPTGDESLTSIELKEEINKLKADRDAFKTLLNQIDAELVNIQTQVTHANEKINKSNSQYEMSSQLRQLTSLNNAKVERMKEKSQVETQLKEIDKDIASKVAIVVRR